MTIAAAETARPLRRRRVVRRTTPTGEAQAAAATIAPPATPVPTTNEQTVVLDVEETNAGQRRRIRVRTSLTFKQVCALLVQRFEDAQLNCTDPQTRLRYKRPRDVYNHNEDDNLDGQGIWYDCDFEDEWREALYALHLVREFDDVSNDEPTVLRCRVRFHDAN